MILSLRFSMPVHNLARLSLLAEQQAAGRPRLAFMPARPHPFYGERDDDQAGPRSLSPSKCLGLSFGGCMLNDSTMSSRTKHWRLVAVIVTATAVFVADSLLPRGYALWLLYTPLNLACLWLGGTRASVTAALNRVPCCCALVRWCRARACLSAIPSLAARWGW